MLCTSDPSKSSNMRIALYQPDIPQNTGTILRMAACMGLSVDVIGPAGFDLSERTLRRAALDYLAFVDVTRHASWDTFLSCHQVASAAPSQPKRLILLTSKGDVVYTRFQFHPGDTLLVGRESAGVPAHVHTAADARIVIPMRTGLRSLNIAVATAMVVGEAIRQIECSPNH
jgi:tRNA (cytidine/uridine-2'-O-)-methyltransferase